MYPNPDRRSISFMRSYPNQLPLSGAVSLRIAAQLESSSSTGSTATSTMSSRPEPRPFCTIPPTGTLRGHEDFDHFDLTPAVNGRLALGACGSRGSVRRRRYWIDHQRTIAAASEEKFRQQEGENHTRGGTRRRTSADQYSPLITK